MVSDGAAVLAFDTGGTFTDFALLHSGGRLRTHKVLSTPDAPADAVLRGIDELVAESPEVVRRGGLSLVGATTIVANAIVERKGARAALITTRGFRDMLEIRDEARYDLYDLNLQFPPPLVPRNLCFEVHERVDAAGRVLEPLDQDELSALIARLGELGVEAVAVCLLHSYRFPDHEEAIRHALANELENVHISVSSQIAPEVRELDRAQTTVVNAYAQPAAARLVSDLRRQLAARDLQPTMMFMTSAGGVVPAETVAHAPARVIESGPAAGVIAAARYGARAGHQNVLSFDMGGTTAKLCIVRDGAPTVTPALEVARVARFKRGSGFTVKVPSIDLIEIGAGGGSIAWMDQLGLLRVGPESAAAAPGPACYGRGGSDATVTDADLVLGYLGADSFLGGDMPLSAAAARSAIGSLAKAMDMSVERCAWGIHDLVNENMSTAAWVHAAEKGVDIRDFCMVAFGGAGPLHACGVARRLGVRTVMCPPRAGVASALGLLGADRAVDLAISAPILVKDVTTGEVAAKLAQLKAAALDALMLDSASEELQLEEAYGVDLRYRGQGHEITLDVPGTDHSDDSTFRRVLTERFAEAYEGLYGRRIEGPEIEALTWRARIIHGRRAVPPMSAGPATSHAGPADAAARPAYLDGEFVMVPVLSARSLEVGATIEGPAIVEQREATALIPGDGVAEVDRDLNIIIHLG